jgi:hypothetical protein
VQSTVLTRDEWLPRATAHAERVDTWVQPHLERRQRGVAHPVHDFLFTYYSQRPAALRRWHPGYGVTLLDAPEYGALPAYGIVPDVCAVATPKTQQKRRGLSVSEEQLVSQGVLVESIRRLLVATAARAPVLGCFGLHEWAMVYRTEQTRHDRSLRLGAAGTDEVVESHRVACSHFDAFRFFTEPARSLNTLDPGRDDRADHEQPGCLHAGMDLYKHAFRLTPLVASELVADCFELAWDIRELDMRASPYDLRDLGYEPVRIETPEGKAEYVAAQRAFAERAAPLRERLIDHCERLLSPAGRVPVGPR